MRETAKAPGQGRILVTGSTGRLGRILRLAWAARPPGPVVWQVRRPPAGPAEVVWDILGTDYAGPAPGVVLNLAGPIGAARPQDHAALALRVCDMAARTGAAHVFLASSAAVYGATPAGEADEQAPLAPVSGYGRAKAAMERAVDDWARARAGCAPGVTILRIGNVAGADALLGPRRARVDLDVFPGQPGGPLRSYIGPVTLARVLGRLAEAAARGQALPAVLNVASPAPVLMADLARAAGLAVTPRPASDAAIARVVLSTRRLQALYAFPPGASLPEHMVEQLRRMGAYAP